MIFDTLDKLEMYIPLVPALRAVADAMDHDNIYDLPEGNYKTLDENVSYTVRCIGTTSSEMPYCVHKKHCIVSIVLSGQELVSGTWRELKDQVAHFDEKSDTGFFNAEPLSVFQARQGRFVLFFPGEPYKTSVSDGESSQVKKVVFKIKEF